MSPSSNAFDFSQWHILILNGFEIKGKAVVSMDYLSNPYYEIFERCTINQYKVQTTWDVSNALLTLKETTCTRCLVIYVGHGDVRTRDYPFVSPFNGSFNITRHKLVKNANGERVHFKYILDCCNVNDHSRIRTKKIAENKPKLQHNCEYLLTGDWKVVHMTRGLENFTMGNATCLNYFLFQALQYDLQDQNMMFGVWNSLLKSHYVTMHNIVNKKIKLVLGTDVKYTYISAARLADVEFDEPEDVDHQVEYPPNNLENVIVDLYNVPSVTERL